MTGRLDPLAFPTAPAVPDSDVTVGEARESRAKASGSARVVAEGLRKSYGKQAVLDGLDLTLAPRSLVAVAGSNGIGKSTLLSCLAGTIRYQGSVRFEGQRVGGATRGRIAYLPQRLRLPGSSSGREVMKLFKAFARGAPDRVELPDGFLPSLDKPVGQLSGGQAQRVGLAAVLQGSPDLVLLDEPFANLDDEAREQAHRLLRAHRDAGATVLIASPTALDLLAMIDRVLLLENGGIGFDGAPSRYAGSLEMTVWVRPGDVTDESLAGLAHVLRTRPEGDWVALECHEGRAIGLLRDLEALGIAADRVRLGGPVAEARVSTSPGVADGSDVR
jgi:ABC-type multidrug transport system ATPase subunit